MIDQHPSPSVDYAVAGISLASFAAYEIWLKHTGELASSLVPIFTIIVLALTIYRHFHPQAVPSEATEKATDALGIAKKAGAIAAVLAAIVALVAFWKRPEQQPVAALLAPAARRARDDEGGDDDESDTPGPSGYPAWIAEAKRWIGTTEALKNGRKNPDVCAMFAAVDYYDPKTVDCRKVPWCAAFVNFCLTNANVPGTRSAAARSFAERPRLFERLDDAQLGCVVVLPSSRGPEAGHVGFYVGEGRAGRIRVLGGNQNDSVDVEEFPASRVVGYFWPRGFAKSRTARGSAATFIGASAGGGAVAYGELAPDPVVDMAEKAKDALDTARVPLEAINHPKAMKLATMIGLAVMAITVGLALYTLWRQRADYKQGRL